MTDIFNYPPRVLAQLALHGIRPAPSTRPELVHEFVSDLYRYELRRLRARLIAGEVPKAGYYEAVVTLRRLYPLVSMRPGELAEQAISGSAPLRRR